MALKLLPCRRRGWFLTMPCSFILFSTTRVLAFSSTDPQFKSLSKLSAIRLSNNNNNNNHPRSHLPTASSSQLLLSTTPSHAARPLTATELDPTQSLQEAVVETINRLVDERGAARWEGNYEQADQLKQDIWEIDLPEELELLLEDLPRSKGGGSVWKLFYRSLNEQEALHTIKAPSVLQLAHAALGLAVSCSKTMVPSSQKQNQLNDLVEEAKESLRAWKKVQEQLSSQQPLTIADLSLLNPATSSSTGWVAVETSLRGRKAADSAFWFALAGVTDQELFDLLTLVCTKELTRFGMKATCRAKDIHQMMDRFAAAGIQPGQHPALEATAQQCLQAKQTNASKIGASSLSSPYKHHHQNLLALHSDRCLLMLWKFAARQKKQQSFLQSAQKHWEKQQTETSSNGDLLFSSIRHGMEQEKTLSWEDRFEDPTKPLVIDIGCGMGISLLGLASLPTSTAGEQNQDSTIFDPDEFRNCNLIGVDLSGLAIGYAQGIAERWGLSHILYFEVDTAESLLERVRDSYPGPVSLCLVQFPTPYRLSVPALEKNAGLSSGNSQLPTSALEGFMVSPNLLQLVHNVLSNNCNSGVTGKLLLQSNCEDVALWMQQTAVQARYQRVTIPKPVDNVHKDNLPQRTQNWIAMGGERAVGNHWSATSLLPGKGSTETEVACRVNETPIHRCVLTPTNS